MPVSEQSPTLQLWYEFASTYSYPAAMRANEVAAKQGVRISWQPFLLGPIFKDLGWSTSPFNLQPDKGRYMWRDLERTCNSLNIPFHRPDLFPQNGLEAARVALAMPDDGTRSNFSKAIYQAQFGERKRIDEPETIRSALASIGSDIEGAIARAREPDNKATLRKQVETARELGIFGAPTFVTSDQEIFWGNDRLDQAIAWELARAR